MLSSVSRLVDKAFVLGYVLPALLFALAALGIFGCPQWLGAACDPKTANPFADLTYAALGVYVIAVFLLTVNYSLYRILEGYVPPFSWLGPLRTWHVHRLNRIEDEIRRMDDSDEDSSVKTWKLLLSYPRDENEVLPTAFGNAIRAFEVYPKEIYGADSISVWPRLSAVIPATFQTLMNDAKAQVDFFVNLCILMFALGIAALVRVPPVAVPLLIGSVVAYYLAVSQIGNWGELVKAAFDCYLPALEKQLGYEFPESHEGRRAFWTAFSQRALYRVDFGNRFQPVDRTEADASAHEAGDDADDGADKA